jgi:hypothetical protein
MLLAGSLTILVVPEFRRIGISKLIYVYIYKKTYVLLK